VTTSAVATLIAEGHFGQLPVVMDNSRKLGMSSLTDSLRRFVQSGAVDVREAYRNADDRAAFLAVLKQDGVDTLRRMVRLITRATVSPAPSAAQRRRLR
jgi:Tfp pilus assembly ATPase PilU